jgi:hypothetical protein
MADFDNVFGGVKILANSNSDWISSSQNLMNELTVNIEKQLDNIEYVMKNADKSGCDILDLQNIYSIRLGVYEQIVNLMTTINDSAKAEIDVQKKIYNNEYKKYEDIFKALKSRI